MSYCEYISSRTVTIRKKRQCFSCLRIFDAGQKMNNWVGKIEGDFCSSYSCMTCFDIMNIKQDDDLEYFPEGYVKEMLKNKETPEILLEQLKMNIKHSL